MPNRGLTPRNDSEDMSLPAHDPFLVFRREIDQQFDSFFAPVEGRTGEGGSLAAWPRIDVHESEAAYTVIAELPGLEAKDVDLNLRDNSLTFSGQKRQEEKSEQGGRMWVERSFGERTIPFDNEINAEGIEASCKNGVLTVILPKSEQAQDRTRKVEIKPN